MMSDYLQISRKLCALILILVLCLSTRVYSSTKSENELFTSEDSASFDLEIPDMCCICQETMEYDSLSFLTRCGHWFHEICIDRWIKSDESKPCPTCRLDVSSSKDQESSIYSGKIKKKSFEVDALKKVLKYSITNSQKIDYDWIINEILKKQPEQNIKDSFEGSLFKFAIKNNNAYAVEYFLKQGEDVSDLSEEQHGELTKSAIKLGNSDFAMFMIERTSVLERDFDDIFFLASKNNFVKIVKLMIQRGADVNKKEVSSEMNSLQLAASGDHIETFRVLLESGEADLTVTDELGMNLFQSSISMGNARMVRMLLDLETPGSDHLLNKPDSDGRSPLLLACINERENVIEVLVGAGAEVDCECPCGWNPIEYLIYTSNEHDDEHSNSDDSMSDDSDETSSNYSYTSSDSATLDGDKYSSHDKLFAILLDQIKDDRQKLESALESAQEYSKYYYIKKIQAAIMKLRLKKQKFKEIAAFNRNGFPKLESIKYQIENCLNLLDSVSDYSRNALFRNLGNLINDLFEEGNYEFLLNLIFERERSILFDRALSYVTMDLWQMFFDSVFSSMQKNKLIDFILDYSDNSMLTNYYIAYAFINGTYHDERLAELLPESYPLAINVARCMSRSLKRRFDLNLFQKFELFLNQLKEKLHLNTEDELEMLRNSSDFFLNEIKALHDKSYLPAVLRTTVLDMYSLANRFVDQLYNDENEEIVSNIFAEMGEKKLIKLAESSLYFFLIRTASLSDFPHLFKFLRLLPEAIIARIYNSENFCKIIIGIMKISEFSIIQADDDDYQYIFTFKATAEQSALGFPEFIEHLPEVSKNASYFVDLIPEMTFESVSVLQDYIQAVSNISKGFKELLNEKLIHHESIQLIIESNSFVDLLQSEGIKLNFSARFIDKISISNLSEKFKQQDSILLIPKDLEHVPIEDVGNWNRLEVLTGVSIDRLVIEHLIPKIEADPVVYLNARNAFIYWMNSPLRDLMWNIKSVDINILLYRDPDLAIFNFGFIETDILEFEEAKSGI